ncbi:MAG: hypothetical protein WCT10_03770 [Patescibacteria group bacterium]
MREGEGQLDPEQRNPEIGKIPEQDRARAGVGKIPEFWGKDGEAPAEIGRELIATNEAVAEIFWGRAADFAESAAAQGLSRELGPFLKKFSELNDRTFASGRLRAARIRVAEKLPPAS